MKRIILLAALFGIILGAGVFFSSVSVTQPPVVTLQNSLLPQGRVEAVSLPQTHSIWFTAIGFTIGVNVGLGTFFLVKARE